MRVARIPTPRRSKTAVLAAWFLGGLASRFLAKMPSLRPTRRARDMDEVADDLAGYGRDLPQLGESGFKVSFEVSYIFRRAAAEAMQCFDAVRDRRGVCRIETVQPKG